MEKVKKVSLLSPILKWFMFAMILANIAASMYGMLLPIYLSEIGASIAQIGLVFTVTAGASLVLQVFGGWISDMIGRLNAIAIGSVGGVVGYIFLIIAPTWQWMVVAIIFSNFPRALVGPSFGAFIAENSTEENRGQVYGITDTIFQITGIIGPPLGGYLMGLYDFKTMMIVSAILYTFASTLRVWMAKRNKKEDSKEVSEEETSTSSNGLTASSFKESLGGMAKMIFGGGVITWIFITDGVRDIAFRLSGELQPLYLEQVAGIGVVQIGILGAIFSAAMMLTPIISGKMSDKYGERVPISMGFSMVVVAFAIFLNVSTFIGFILTWIVFGAAVGLLSPAYQSYISRVVTKKMLGIFSGVFYGSIGIISMPAPYFGALLWESYTPKTPFLITAIVVSLAVIPIWFVFKPIKKTVEPSVELDNLDSEQG